MRKASLYSAFCVACFATLPSESLAQAPMLDDAAAQAFARKLATDWPIATWPLETRGPAMKALRACAFAAGMMTSGGSDDKSTDARLHETLAFAFACVNKEMPEEWPGRSVTEALKNSEYREAVRLGSRMADPDSWMRRRDTPRQP
jgi:hypothetical protein